jgi:hypothetical protein
VHRIFIALKNQSHWFEPATFESSAKHIYHYTTKATPEHWYLPSRPRGVTTLKTNIDITTIFKASVKKKHTFIY